MYELPALLLLALSFKRLGRARAGSVVDRSDLRGAFGAWGLLVAGFGADAFALWLALTTVVLVLVVDCHAWVGAVRAARRESRRMPPQRAGVDFGLGQNWTLGPLVDAPYRAAAAPVVASLGSPSAAARALRGNVCGLLASVLVTAGLAAWPGRGCVGVGAFELTRTRLSVLHAAVAQWRATHWGVCPSVARLQADDALDTDFRATDAWDNPIEITCVGDGFTVRSAGPDRHIETADDLQLGCLPRSHFYSDSCHQTGLR
jgi:hypothetical protein